MAWVLEDLAMVSGSDASARQLIKPWAATARAGPSAFAINADTAGGIASVSGQRLSFYAGIDAIACCRFVATTCATNVSSRLGGCHAGL
jgi:hypothetical protein